MPRDPEIDRLQAQQRADAQNIPALVSRQSFNPYVDAQAYSFNPNSTSDQNHNFERYYSHPSYSKLGYNPWVDNEALYNNQSSGAGDMWRATKTAAKLMATGFSAPIRSYGDLLSGNFTGLDEESAREMQYYNTVGSSTRGGVSGFASNVIANSGYTFGMIGETLLENFLTAGVAGISKVASVGKFAKDLGKYDKAVDALKGVTTYSAAEKLWNKAKGFLPASNTIGVAKDLLQASRMGESTTKAVAAYKTAGAFYRDLQAANFTVSEAKMEGAMAQKDAEERMISQFRDDHDGRYPDSKEYEEIHNRSQDAGMSTMIANVPVIFLTNKLTFDPLFKSFSRPTEFAINGTRIIREGDKLVETSLKTRAKSLLKPQTWGAGAIKYFKGNISEGLQETAQEITSGTAVDYYSSLYRNKTRAGLDQGRGEYTNDSVWDALSKNVSDQFSGKGFETFASGFFMGGLVRPITSGVERLAGYKKTKNEYASRTLDKLNEYYKDPLRFFSSRDINYTTSAQAVQKQYEALQDGDKKQWLDQEFENLASNTMLALNSGTYDLFLDKLKGIKSMTPEAIKDTYGRDGQDVLAKVDDLIARAESIKQKHESWNPRFQNPFNPAGFQKDTPEYQREAQGYMAWEQAKRNVIVKDAKFEDNRQRIQKITGDILEFTGASNIQGNKISALFSPQDTARERRLLQDEVEAFEYGDNKPAAKQARAHLAALDQFDRALQSHYLGQVLADAPKEMKTQMGAPTRGASRKSLYRAYQKYVGVVGSQAGAVLATRPDLEESFDALLDMHELAMDNQQALMDLNVLANPKGFLEYYERVNKSFSDLYQAREDILKEGIELAQKSTEDNSVLQALHARGYVLSPKGVHDLINDKKVPTEFFDTNAKQVVDDRGGERWRGFQSTAEAYIQSQKATQETEAEVKPEPAPEAQPGPTPEQAKKFENVLERLRKVETMEQLEEQRSEFAMMFSLYSREERQAMHLIGEEVNQAFDQKEQELQGRVTLENLVPGTIVLMHDREYGRGYVLKQTKKYVTVQMLDKPIKVQVMEDNLKQSIKSIEGIKTPEVQATPAETKTAQANNTSTGLFIKQNRQALEKAHDEALADPETVEVEFFETLGCQ